MENMRPPLTAEERAEAFEWAGQHVGKSDMGIWSTICKALVEAESELRTKAQEVDRLTTEARSAVEGRTDALQRFHNALIDRDMIDGCLGTVSRQLVAAEAELGRAQAVLRAYHLAFGSQGRDEAVRSVLGDDWLSGPEMGQKGDSDG